MKLGRREKRVILLGCLVVATLLFFQLGLSPALERMKTLDRLVTQKERDVQEMQGLRET